MVDLLAQRRTHLLVSKESELLLEINQSVSAKTQACADEVVANRQSENEQRFESLVELAKLRRISLRVLMKKLGLEAPLVV